MEYFILCLSIPIGILVGIMPALGASVTLVLLYFFIHGLTFDVLIAFYAAMITASQFSGSVVALWLGVPGEITSIPILKEREHILKNQQLYSALKRTAIGSSVAALASLLLLAAIIFTGQQFSGLLKTAVLLGFLTMILVASICWPGNKVLVNIMLVAAGLVIGNIGYHTEFNAAFLTFDYFWLYGGLPLFPMLLGMYAVPLLWDSLKMLASSPKFDRTELVLNNSPDPFVKPMVRGTAVGFIMGLVPIVGVVFSSAVSHYLESKIKGSTALSRVTSAETANNAAVVSVLAPLLIFGIAIQPSEAIILSILETRGWSLASITPATFAISVISIVVAIAISFVLCFNFARFTVRLLQNHYKIIIASVIGLVVYNVYALGAQEALEVFYISVFLIFLLIGGLCKYAKIDVLPFIFTWLVGEYILVSVVRITQLYF